MPGDGTIGTFIQQLESNIGNAAADLVITKLGLGVSKIYLMIPTAALQSPIFLFNFAKIPFCLSYCLKFVCVTADHDRKSLCSESQPHPQLFSNTMKLIWYQKLTHI